METVLVVGSSGNVGISVILAARKAGRSVLAVVRNQASQDKILQSVGSIEGIRFVEADVMQPDAIQKVVDNVKASKLPAFQHVYSAVGGNYLWQDLHETSVETLNNVFKTNFEPNYRTYIATIPYLREQNHPNASWTLITGGLGALGVCGATTVSQGALYSMAAAACFENLQTNIRFNEVNLAIGVKSDLPEADGTDYVVSSAEFAQVYEKILQDTTIRFQRVTVAKREDIADLKMADKLPDSPMIGMLLKNGRVPQMY